MSERALRKKLVRLAHEDPRLRPHLLPILQEHAAQRQAAFRRTAVSKATEEFTTWALNQPPMDAKEVENYIKGKLGIKTSPKKPSTKGMPRFKPGDTVRVDKTKHKTKKYPIDTYEQHHGAIGTVVEVIDKDCVVDLEGGTRGLLFPGAMMGRGTGLMKYTPPYTVEGSPMFEMIYIAGGKPTPDQKIVVELYLGRARPGETREGQYYSGSCTYASTGQNGYYFKALPQQRTQILPGMKYSEIGWRTFSPTVGKVHYIGLLGRRPRTWKAELDAMRAGAPV